MAEKVETVVLSTTNKVKARIDRKNKAEGGADVEMSVADETEKPGAVDDKKDDKDKAEDKKEPEVAVPEPTEYTLNNPARVLKA